MAQQTSSDTPTRLWVERTGTRRYTGHSSRGAEVLVGSVDVEGVFTPGELMKIALAACTGMSADFTVARRLGDEYEMTIRVSGAADRENELYPKLEEELQIDLSQLEEDDREKLLTLMERAVDKACTVGRTLEAGTEVSLSFDVDTDT